MAVHNNEKIKMLFVDDNKDKCNSFMDQMKHNCFVFNDEGIDIVIKRTLTDAVNALEVDTFDIAVLDIQLGDYEIGGIELWIEFIKKNLDTNVILYSAQVPIQEWYKPFMIESIKDVKLKANLNPKIIWTGATDVWGILIKTIDSEISSIQKKLFIQASLEEVNKIKKEMPLQNKYWVDWLQTTEIIIAENKYKLMNFFAPFSIRIFKNQETENNIAKIKETITQYSPEKEILIITNDNKFFNEFNERFEKAFQLSGLVDIHLESGDNCMENGLHYCMENQSSILMGIISLPRTKATVIQNQIKLFKERFRVPFVILEEAKSFSSDSARDFIYSGLNNYLPKNADILIQYMKYELHLGNILRWNELLLNKIEKKVTIAIQKGIRFTVDLLPQEFSVLQFLLENKGIRSHSDICRCALRKEFTEKSEKGLKQSIKQIRAGLEKVSSMYGDMIETAKGGYGIND